MTIQGQLTSISQYPDVAFAGMLVGIDGSPGIRTGLNNSTNVLGVYDLVFSAVNSATYTATIYGVAVSYAADGSATLAEIRAGIIAAIVAQPALVLRVTAVASGNNVRVTELNSTLYGASGITGLDANTTMTTVTAGSLVQPMPAGIMVAQGPNAQDIRLMAASTDILFGITVHQHQPIQELTYPTGANLYPNISQVSCLYSRGPIWVVTETAVVMTDVPAVRYAVGAGGTQMGAFRVGTDTSTAVALTGKARFRTAQPTAGGLVQVELTAI